MKVKLNNVRLAFPQLFEAKTVNGEGEPAFSAAFIMGPKHPDVKILQAAIKAVAAEKWGAKADANLKAIQAKDAACLHDGESKADYEGYAGNMFVSSRNKVRPLVLDTDKSPLTSADGRPYAGCYVNASIELWAQDNKFGKRVNASLRGVQFYKDGDAFAGGGTADPDDFESIENGADADSLV